MSIRRHIHLAFSPVASSASEKEEMEALRMIQQEQRLIADELEDTFAIYDQKLQTAAKRIASLGEGSVTQKELEELRTEQLALWRLVRRAQAAERSTRELAREVEEWKMHDSASVAEGHPDHPETRAEIAESELRVRGVAVPERLTISRPDVVAGVEVTDGFSATEEEASTVVSDVVWNHETDDRLVQEIYQHQRELSRTSSPADIVEVVRSLRSLHAHLRLHDRRSGRPRLRWKMGLEGV